MGLYITKGNHSLPLHKTRNKYNVSSTILPIGENKLASVKEDIIATKINTS